MLNRLTAAFGSTRGRAAALFLCLFIGLLVGWSGSGAMIDDAVQDARFRLRAHDASGDLHIVEMDARSIATIDRWPWPRSNYARAIDNLRKAGAAGIAFDVDFSSRSTGSEDAALAGALARADGMVILPTFRQAAGGGVGGYTDALPAPGLRDHAMLSAVSVSPDADGNVRNVVLGTITADTPRPSLSAMIAGRAGKADSDFPVDYAIRPGSIPRHSFIDIRDGRFDPAEVRGKKILFGATAIELGDRYAVPTHGVIPGVVIQALAAETLANGVPQRAGWTLPLALSLGFAWAILRAQRRDWLLTASLGGPVAIFIASLLAENEGWLFDLSPALTAILAAIGVALSVRWLAALKRRRAHDEATGLPNRIALIEAINGMTGAVVIAARISEYDKLAAALGARESAELVCRVRDRISALGGGLIVYRVEDRLLAWPASVGIDEVEQRYEQLRALMLSPVEVGGRRVDVTLVVGVAAVEIGATREAIDHAALAADHALAAGAGLHVHAVAETEEIDREISLLGELDEAIAKGEITVLYQPKLAIASNRITSVEALVRWNHSTRGFLRPDLFIPLAERNDRIASLTLHVLDRTIEDLKFWAAGGHPITGAVNLSAKLLTSSQFIADVRARIERGDLDSSLLTFEVTESAAMIDPAGAVAALESLKALGVSVSMDDYGTGQSTLTYIKQLPLDELKIDRSFVQFAHQNRGDAVLVRSTIELAHELGLKVVAEGIEEAECLAFLASVGCDYAQGYLISKPVTSEAIGELLAAREPLAA